MTDNLLQYSSLGNILRYAAPQPTPRPVQPVQPVGPRPIPGIAGPIQQPPAPPPTFSQIAEQHPQQIPLAPIPKEPETNIGLIRDALRRVESSGNYQAKNPHTSASGAYQYINSTWGNYGGYPEARLAPKHVQDARVNEDIAKSLRRFNGDPFRVIANHMLPAQANKPWLWTQPSRLMNRGKPITVPPVAEYIAKVVKGTPYEQAFQQYLTAHSRPEE